LKKDPYQLCSLYRIISFAFQPKKKKTGLFFFFFSLFYIFLKNTAIRLV